MKLAYVYFEDEPGRRAAGSYTKASPFRSQHPQSQHSQKMRQPQRKRRDVGHHHQKNEHGHEPREHRDGELTDAHPGDAGGDIEIEPDRRMAEADFHIDRHQDP